MSVIEGKIDLDSEDKKFIDLVNSPFFPLYCSKSGYTDDGELFWHFSHALVHRHESEFCDQEGILNSEHYYEVKKIFDKFCQKYNIEYKIVLRAAINFTTHQPYKHGHIHVDHYCEHKVFILYLNDFDGGATYIFNEDNTEKYIITAEKYKAVVFDGDKHAQGFCAPRQLRKVLVITFV